MGFYGNSYSMDYAYDYERLSEVLYPKNLFNRVTYTYGKPGEKYNRAGRLVLVEDASGGEAYYYGNWKSHTNLTHPGKYFRPSKVKIMRPTSPK